MISSSLPPGKSLASARKLAFFPCEKVPSFRAKKSLSTAFFRFLPLSSAFFRFLPLSSAF